MCIRDSIKEKKAKKKKLLPNMPAKFEHPRSNKITKDVEKVEAEDQL